MPEMDHRKRKTSFPAKRSWSPSNVPSWRSGKNKVTSGSSGVKVTRQTKQQKDEAEESRYLDSRGADAGNPFVTYKQQQEAREKSAYQASLKRQAEMQKARDLAYNVVDGKQQSNFDNLSNSQKQFLIDSGFAAAESSGVLGGTMGAELVSNQLKKNLSNATNEKEYKDALKALDNLHGDYKITDQMNKMGLLQHDPSAVYSWDDVQNNDYLKNAFYGMQSKDLTPSQYTKYMNRIGAFGHQAPLTGGGGGGGGGGYGYGGGGSDGGGGGGYSFNEYAQQGIQQAPGVNPGTLQETVSQGFLGGMGAPRFSRGGIVSLLRLGE